MANDPVVCLKDVWFSYDGRSVLEAVNLDVKAGDLIFVVGPNGGGKSTLLKLILGAVGPTRGQVRVFGQSPERVRQRVGYMPQQLQYDSAFPVTVRDVVLMGRLGGWVGGWYGRADKLAVEAAMEELGVADLAKRPFFAMSGGQRQRVLIARAMACQPDLLLLDEPMASVDAGVEARFFGLLEKLNQTMTIVMVSHDLKFVSGMADKAVCVSGTVAVHPTAEITGAVVEQLYGRPLRVVRHDHDAGPTEHDHD